MAELDFERNKLDTILNSMVDGVYMTNASRAITFWNKAAEVITGFRAEDVLGRKCSEVLCHVDESGKSLCEDSCPITETMEIKSPISGKNVRSATAAGETIPVSVSCSPIVDSDGTVLGAIEVFRDITEQKKLEKQKNDFYSMVTHDLKAPLQSIMGFAELLTELPDEKLKADAKEFGALILQNAVRLNGMITSYLAVSKIESGAGPSFAEASVTDLLKRVHASFSPLSTWKGIALGLSAPDIPRFVFDSGLVDRAVSNLVANAFKFTPKGGRVDISARLADGHVTISVSDTGRGIPADEIGRVFDMYYRAGGSSSAEGSGLGLSVVRHVAEAHGGEALAESEPGKGSTFTLRLPFKRKEDPAE